MRFRLLLAFIFCSTSVFAQIQKEKGEIALSNGDVLSGTITYYYDKPNELSFYNEQGRKNLFHPSEIREIKLNNGEKFVAKNFSSNHDSVTLILQVLIESSQVSLFMREDDANPYYYVSKNNVLHRLENNDVILNQNKRNYKKKDNKYVGTLSSLMSDRVDILDKLQSIKLNENDLTKTIVDYNKGDLSYYWKAKSDREKESNWVAFSQYSQHGSFLGSVTTAHSFGQMIGVQYYFSKSSRHSLKISLEHSDYTLEWKKFKATGVGFRYEYAFKQAEKYGVYMMLHLAEMASVEFIERNHDSKPQMLFIPRLSPGLGFEVKPSDRIALYGELNNLLQIKYVPKSFSFGLKYDFGSVSR